jgi:UDP-2,3-diacylglucosamine pyrophosphatase LpxH/glycosyltransferase involved in cell wall biosynthesis
MKIDIVTDTYAPDVNGVAMTLGKLTEGLRARGHRVHVIHTGATAQAGETVVDAVRLLGYRDVRVGLPKPFDLRSRWERKRPDVIYVATESPLGKSALKAANALKIPVATGFHTNFHQYVERYGMSGLQSLAMAYLKNFHRRADCTITPSPEMAKQLLDLGVENVALIARGVDTLMFSPAKRSQELRSSWGASDETPVVIMVGRVAAEKNLELGIEAFRWMRLADPNMPCVVVGDGPIRKKLQEDHPWVQFVGVKTGEELAQCYASADVLLFPSETETFGNVLLEAMASGLITVSYDYAASSIHIDHDVNGYKTTKGDGPEFHRLALEALVLPMDHPVRRSARMTAMAHGWDHIISQFEEQFGKLVIRQHAWPSSYVKNEKRPKLTCRTVFLSDIHLGAADSKAKEVVNFLKHLECEKLVLNGDIIDGWALKRGGKWTSRHSRVIRKIIKMTEKDAVEVIYLRGNHDDILERFLPISLGRIKLVKEHIHINPEGKRYLVVHGDGFDSISTHHKWLAVVGAVGYDFLLMVNRFYNRWRSWRGKEYYSLSKKVKAKVKSAVNFVDRYETLLQDLAARRRCEGIICGHIHTPENKQIGDVHYLNSGDWVESLSAIIEHDDGRMELVYYRDFIRQLHLANYTPYESVAAVA